MCPSEVSRRPRVSDIIAFDGRKGLLSLLLCREGQRPDPGRNEFGKSGILNDDRACGGEVASRTAAEPAGAKGDVNILGNRNLPARPYDVVLIIGRGQGDCGPIRYGPTAGG